MVYFWGMSTWFACPEWYRAYRHPKRSLNELLAESGDGSEVETAAPIEKKEVAAPKAEVVAVKNAPVA